MTTTPEQIAYFTQNTVKNANIQSWITVTFGHIDWDEDLRFVAVEDGRGVEFDLSIYTFESVLYTPVSMLVSFPRESNSSVGNATMTFSRAATTLKRLMRQITPANATQPISCSLKQYQEGVTLPVKRFDGFVAKNFPKISGQDISIQASRYNPALLTSDFITNLDLYPELRTS